MSIRAFTFERYHGKGRVGSTRLRVNQLMKYWPDYQDYKYGENPDVMVWQKVYIQSDWRFIQHFEGIQILDICDPEWMEKQHVVETMEYMNGVVVPTEAMAEFLSQMTDKPIKIIPDRHDLSKIPPPKVHKGKLKSAVWFGYSQNAEVLKDTLPTLQKMGIELTVISDDNPHWLGEHKYLRFDEDTIAQDLQTFDVCILPQGNRPRDRFKSNNKTTLAWLCGLPVVKTAEELANMTDAKSRNEYAKTMSEIARRDYDVRLSVKEMKAFIEELKE